MNSYKVRLIDEKINKKLKSTGGILLKGARYCGKTTTAEFHAQALYASMLRSKSANKLH